VANKNDRACDRCHIGKVRCVGGTPCTSCNKKGLDCKTERLTRRTDTQHETGNAVQKSEISDIVVDNTNLPDLGSLSLATAEVLDPKPGAAYFTYFHQRWPILHAPTFDETTVSTLLANSVRMIDDWLGTDSTNQRRETASQIYPHLMDAISTKIVSLILICFNGNKEADYD
jgi:hypothetical protein